MNRHSGVNGHDTVNRDGVLWRSDRLGSAEYCTLGDLPDGYRLAGTVVLPIDGRPGLVEYEVDADRGWRTRGAHVRWRTAGPTAEGDLRLTSGAGGWTLDGVTRPDLAGCVDVDLGFSPCTNTLPVRRLLLTAERSASIRVVWVRFPGFAVDAGEQSYDHLGGNRWRYRSGTFTADLELAESGLVRDYAGVWTALAPQADPRTGPARRCHA